MNESPHIFKQKILSLLGCPVDIIPSTSNRKLSSKFILLLAVPKVSGFKNGF